MSFPSAVRVEKPEELLQKASDHVSQTLADSKKAMIRALDDGKVTANRLMKRGQRAAEDLLAETTHQLKKHPVSSVAIAFGAGALMGAVIAGVLVGGRRR